MRLLVCMLYLFFVGAHAQDPEPKIIGQKTLSTDQGIPITIKLTDLQVEETYPDDDEADDDDNNSGHGSSGSSDNQWDDDDNTEQGEQKNDKKGSNKGNKNDKGKKNNGNRQQAYPNGYTLIILSGPNYSFRETTVTPDASFAGELKVPVRVANDSHTSQKYNLKINVRRVNKPPVITGHLPLKTQMETPLTVELSDLLVTDPDDSYPDGFSLSLSPGENYRLNKKATVTPDKGFTGDLIVPAVVNDGEANSAPFNIRITVTPAPVQNTIPVITGQVPITIQFNQSITVLHSHLKVTDPDDEYPKDHTLKMFPGKNYTLKGTTVTPSTDFSGELTVGVSVNDGSDESAVFPLRVTVNKPPNRAPLITGQTELKIVEGEQLRVQFSHLVVEDGDSKYPDDFTLKVVGGQNYSVSENTITPIKGFLGTLKAQVTVHDGKVSSPPFDLKIEVVVDDRFEIVGQKPLRVPEDSSILVTPEHLIVNDPSDNYPAGFTLQLVDGNSYDVADNVVRPTHNFSGTLSIPVIVSRQGQARSSYTLVIIVTPVNDPPELSIVNGDPLSVYGMGPWLIFPQAELVDVDDSHLLFAEIGFDGETYRNGHDKLEHDPTDSLHVVFDSKNGVLFLVGRASLEHYEQVIRSVRYTYGNSDSVSLINRKKVYATLNDGKNTSARYERILTFDADLPLDIPNAFTPNNDHANDTWKILPLNNMDQTIATVRVFDKRGNIVFESTSLDNEWDGLFNGSPLPADVYFYTIEMQHSHKKLSYKGIVTILR